MNKAIQKHIPDFFYKMLWFNSDVPTVYQNVVIFTYKKKGSQYSFPSDVICLEILPYNTFLSTAVFCLVSMLELILG